ncbi:MAG: immune inhibitor A [Ignavibacteria bacterium]|nr:immune inhibitor A [Ignavibacteria bacterium]
MMRRIIVVCLCLSVLVFSQTYKKIRVQNFTPGTIPTLLKAGIDLEGSTRNKDGSFEFILSPESYKQFVNLAIPYSVVIDDLEAYYRERSAKSAADREISLIESKSSYGVTGFGYGSMGGFYTFAEMVANLDSMHAKYPNLVSEKFSIGNSTEGRPLWAVRISDNPGINQNKPQVFFDGLIHAREPESMACVLYYMWYLIENYGTNAEVTYLVNNREFYFVPCFNPDGYEYNHQTNPSGGGLWRLNRRNNGNNTYGVDLNRNFGYKWGYDDIGSSSIAGDETYRGPSAFSEPETQHIRDLFLSKNFKTYINYHSYNNSIIYPWGYINGLTPDSALYNGYAAYMAKYNGYTVGNSYTTLGYCSNGTARDWGYGEQTQKGKTISYTFEVGGASDDFWPPQTRILPLAEGNIRPNLFQSWIAGAYTTFNSASYNRSYFIPNDTITMKVVLKNSGLSSGKNTDVSIMPVSPGIQMLTSTTFRVTDSIPALSTYSPASSVKFIIQSGIPANTVLKIAVKTALGQATTSLDTIALTVGIPTYLFRDSGNSIATNWTVTATPSSAPKWETTTATYNSPFSCYTDSKNGNYISSSTVTMTTTNPINLTGYSVAKLNFATRYDLEKKWDCGMVQISTTGGVSWTSLPGKYTIAASGSGTQKPAGTPCYDGNSGGWLNEEIDLSPYANQQIKLRFQLMSDNADNFDGWYVDDIAVVVYTLPAPPALTWSCPITVSDTGSFQVPLVFGTSSSATDGLDTALGEIPLPPKAATPPTGVLFAYFTYPGSSNISALKDFRNDSLTSITWLMSFLPSSSTRPVKFTWDPAVLPVGKFILKDIITGTVVNIDMRTQNQVTITNPELTKLQIEYKKETCGSIGMNQGWNLVSVPVQAANMAPTGLFPQATSSAFGFDNGYTTMSVLQNGKGYWVRYPQGATLSVCGLPLSANTVELKSGWNLIAPYGKNCSTNLVTTIPANIINSSFFEYNNGYSVAATMEKGKGYWVRATQAGTLNLPQTETRARVLSYENAVPRSLIITSADGCSSRLLLEAQQNPALPPLPPTGIFDARFSTGNYAEGFSGTNLKITLNSARYPVTIAAENCAVTLRDAATNGHLFTATIRKGEQSQLLNDQVSSLLVSSALVPDKFALEQNYPNPFNPVTRIRYQIPTSAHVTLQLYNILGELIKTPVDETKEAGDYTVDVTVSGLNSGVYFYTIKAGTYTATKKMVVLK